MMARKKSLFITYVLWFFAGWTGIHHFYLGRDKQAFIWWSTAGIFHLGWIRDFWRIPEYVDDANEETYVVEQLKNRVKLRKVPLFSSSRFTGTLLVGYFYGLLIRFAVPEEAGMIITGLLVCIGITVGVFLVGNVGREQGPFMMPLGATIASYLALSYISGKEANYVYCAVACSSMFNNYRSYKTKIEEKTLCTRIARLTGGGVLIIALFLSFLYFNASITVEDGETIFLRDAVSHFFKSPAWLEFERTMWHLYEGRKSKSWSSNWEDFVQSLDPTGEGNAYKTLGIDSSSSEEDIRRAYKKLVVQWHPDRYKGPNKEDATQRFMEIQQAYELLGRRKPSGSRNGKERTEF